MRPHGAVALLPTAALPCRASPGAPGRHDRAACALLVLFFCAGVASAISLTRGPYLGRPSDSAVAIVWNTDTAGDSQVDYAREAGPWFTIRRDAVETKHRVVLDGLVSGTLYRYRVWSAGVPLADESTFRAPREAAEDRFRFAVIGDTNGATIPSEIADRLADSDVDFALHVGDVVYPSGAEKDYDAQFFRPFAAWLRRGPVLPTLGNHDVVTDRGGPMLANFVLPVNDATHTSRFYAFAQANALFVCLDVESSEFGVGSAQYNWLVRTLRESTAMWKFVYFHAPAYSSAQSDVVVRLILAPVFERFGVDVVFSGHEHLYERTYPIRDFTPSGPGVVYVTEGGGGASLSSFQAEDYSAYAARRFGYVEIAIEGPRLTLTARDPDGSAFDSAVLEKGGAVPPRMPVTLEPRIRRPLRPLAR